MNLKSIWSALEESMNILGDDYGYPAMFALAEKLTFGSNWLTWVTAISIFESEAFTVAEFMRINPYGLARLNEERLNVAVQRGFLTAEGEGRFRATESGEDVARLALDSLPITKGR